MSRTRIDRQTFLANLRRSNLLSVEQFESAARQLPDTNRAWLVARNLVERGLLTKFQAEMLLGGRTGGFVLGQYRILDQLGRGGMGRVFKAVHLTMNRVVALKVVSNRLVKTERARSLFQREVRAAARLIHPNIVTAYDANQAGDRHYLVMEFVDGPNLDLLVGNQGPLPVGQACELMRQAANGLQFASEMGMVHRDIKPANLLVSQTHGLKASSLGCLVKVLDFGLARLHEPESVVADDSGSIDTEQDKVMGTPDYLSPEQAKNMHRVDIRSDLYSLGCSFYFLLTGRAPFPGGTTLEKLLRHNSEEAMPVEMLRPEAPLPVAAILNRLMAKDPAARFQTPAELAAALAPFAVNGPLTWTDESNKELVEPDEGDASDEEPESSLIVTLPADPWLTPLPNPVKPPQRPRQKRSRRVSLSSLLIPFLLAVGILAALIMLFHFLAPR